ncbi:MAG: caspase family protein [Candidatus Aminicenantes bacterium]|nr:caspase family protein [Candidatus Aminicenantes bacterium]
MSKRCLYTSLILFAVQGFLLSAKQDVQTVDPSIIQRYVFAVGANNGGVEREQLQYALSDAKSFLQVFNDLGGVTRENSLFLAEPDIKSLFTELGHFQAKIEESKPDYKRLEFFFYYSGHSDDKNILLGDEKVSYEDLREVINNIDADVRIAILDSCASGAFTRTKGGKKRQPFMMDTAYDMKGYAFMSSSAADEVSQESDYINGSFFTHYLVSGLRGAADVTQDGRVTLNEAYQFAFNETLSQTTKTLSGPQHPNTQIQLSGRGDVVMTDIRQSPALLVLLPDLTGNIFIHDKKNLLVVELTKPSGRRIELGLEEGRYRIINIVDGQVFESFVNLQKDEDCELDAEEFEETDKIYTTPRGDREVKIKENILRIQNRIGFFVEADTVSTRIYGERGILLGGKAGFVFNRKYFLGAGLYGRTFANLEPFDIDVDFSPGRPAYGGLYLAYTASPNSSFHIQTEALMGFGDSWNTNFYIFSPGISAVFRVTRFLQFKGGLNWVFTDKEVGLKKRFWSFGIRIGLQ